MKKLIIILAVIFVLAYCDQPVPNKMAKPNTDSLTMTTKDTNNNHLAQVSSYNDSVTDNLQKKVVKIIKYYTTEPNSAGGVSCNIVWKNISSKTIKYIHFTVTPYNAVGDAVTCSVRGYSETRVQDTGPFKPGKTYGYDNEWDNLWYNYTIKRMKIES